MSLRLARAAALLRLDSDSADAQAWADALWLARVLPAPAGLPPWRADADDAAGPAADTVSQAPTADHPSAGTQADGDAAQDDAASDPSRQAGNADQDGRQPSSAHGREPANIALFAVQAALDGQPVLRASRVAVPAADALPQRGAIERALRPFMRRRPSRSRQLLDGNATAELSAETGQLTPVLRPAPERWFDVVLLRDDSASMAAWGPTLRELRRLLARHGAFSRVHLWQLALRPAQGDQPGQLQLRNEAGALLTPGRLRDPDGRRLVLVLTNGSHAGWRGGALTEGLATLARHSVVALVQMLPRRAWGHTVLGDARHRLYSPEVAAPAGRLWVRHPVTGQLARNADATVLPLLSLEPERLADWAAFTMAPRWLPHLGVRLALTPPAAVAQRTKSASRLQADPGPDARLDSFRSTASPEAFALLRLLAAAPLTLPVMRLVQLASGATPSPTPLAEILLSGLVRCTSPEAPGQDAVFEFLPGVRERLLPGLSRQENRSVDTALAPTRERLRQTLATLSGRSIRDFTALVLDPQGVDRLPADARAFVDVSRQLLALRGRLPAAQAQAEAQAEGGAAPGLSNAGAPPLAAADAAPATPPARRRRVLLLPWAAEAGEWLPLHEQLADALRRRGHTLVTEQAELVIGVGPGPYDAAVDLWLDQPEQVAPTADSVATHQVLGPLLGWPVPAERLPARDALVARLRGRLLHSPFDRLALTVQPMCGARSVLLRVLDDPLLRARWPAGIRYGAWPDSVALRGGRGLLVTTSASATAPQGVSVLHLRYAGANRPRNPVDIGELDDAELQGFLADNGGLPERDPGVAVIVAALAQRRSRLVPVAAALLSRHGRVDGDWARQLPQRPEERFNALVVELVKGLLSDEQRPLFRLAVLKPGYPDMPRAGRELALGLGWLCQSPSDGSAWLHELAAGALGAAFADDLAVAHRSVVTALTVVSTLTASPMSERLLAYRNRHLLHHARAADGAQGVVDLLREPGVLADLLAANGAAALVAQLQTRTDAPPGSAEAALQRLAAALVARASTSADSPLQMRRRRPHIVADLRLLLGPQPPWPDATGLADARRLGLTGAGLRIALPATGADLAHPEFAGSGVHGDSQDSHGLGTGLASLIAGQNLGVAPGAALDVTRLLDSRGSLTEFAMMKWLSQVAALPAEQRPHIVCWPFGTGVGATLRPLQQDTAALFANLALAGVLVVVAAAHQGGGAQGDELPFPAVLPSVLAVGFCDLQGRHAPGSHEGDFRGIDNTPRHVPDVWGPGVNLPLAAPGQAAYGSGSGAPLACAYACGVAALVAEHTGLRGLALKQWLVDTADAQGLVRFVDRRPDGAAGAASGGSTASAASPRPASARRKAPVRKAGPKPAA